MPGLPHRCYVEISRGQIARNYRSVVAAVGPEVEVLGVVKANAYGHGAVEVGRVLEAEGARWLAVSSVQEGVALRAAGLKARILVLSTLRSEWSALLEFELTPSIQSLEELAELDGFARSTGGPIRYHLKIDSGMGRLGTRAPVEAIVAAVRATTHARLEGLMTHFASAADYESPQTDQQIAGFDRICDAFQEASLTPPYLHLASTSAIAYGRRGAWRNLVRAGHALYGYVSPARGSAPNRILEVRPALSWKTKVLSVKEIPEDALVGYGGTFRAPRSMRIAVLAAGYADGLQHRLSSRGKVIAGGKLAPILGTVSMDLTTIDVSHVTSIAPGDEVTLLGSEGEVKLDAQQIARAAGTISYSILCGISARVVRVYVE